MEDIEIARNTKLEPIINIAHNLGIQDDDIEVYGKYKAKIKYKGKENKNSKLILITSINPTPYGEGKTTIAIGLADGLRKIGKNAVLALREPSLGPVFGIKGGATGGGRAQVAPMDDINLHFTGDLHAITSANNLLASIIDNHIYFGNELGFERVVWKRCLDLNDRILRKIEIGLSKEKNVTPRIDGFDITAASEIMAIFCLATDLADLKKRLGQIIVGYTKDNTPIRASQLKVQGAMTALLKDAFYPNLVQTLEHTPCLIHGGPFANIAHGCSSVSATNLALSLGDYTVTEAGFGADLGAEKFLNIKTRITNKVPDAVVCVATIKALKYHGGDNLKNGLYNLKKHIHNLKEVFGLNVIVALNRFKQDLDEEIALIKQELDDVIVSLVEAWEKGGNGAIDLSEKVVELCNKQNDFNFVYLPEDSVKEKIEKVAKKIYGAQNVIFAENVLEKVKDCRYPICIAKTQYSFSDNPKNLECKEPFDIYVRDVEIKAGAEFIVVYCGNIYTMPGLPKIPAAEDIDIDENGNIIGIF